MMTIEAIQKHRNQLGDSADEWLFNTFLFKKVADEWTPTTNAEKRTMIVALLDTEKQRVVADQRRIARADGSNLAPTITALDQTVTNL